MNVVAFASAVCKSRRRASRSSRLAAPRLSALEIVGGSTSFDNFSMAALVSFAALVAMATICRNLLEGCCLSASSIWLASVMPCNAVRLSRSAMLSCHLPRSPAKYAATEQAIMTTNRNRKASATRPFAFRPEGIRRTPHRDTPLTGGRDGENYRLGSVKRERKRASVANTNDATVAPHPPKHGRLFQAIKKTAGIARRGGR